MRTLPLVAIRLLATLWLAAPAIAATETLTVPVTEPQPATLGAELYTPRGEGPHPAVILLHGCGGVSPNMAAWAVWLQSQGYAALVLDSFGGRGLRYLCGDPRPLTGAMRAPDVFAAITALKTTGKIDPNRIAAMGFSHGGVTVLAAWRMHSEHKLRAIIAVYPGCGGPPASADAPPVLMLVGGQDNWAPPENCERLAAASRLVGRPVSIVVYPDAHHGFDTAHLKGRVSIPVARGGKGATLEYNPKAHEDAEKQVKRFLETHLTP